jgi:hypothetical protein
MSDNEWIDLSASERACYNWPDDTDLHRQCRAAYVAGAGFYARPDRIEALEAALHDAFLAMCSHRDNPDDEVFQDAIDALGLAALDKDAGK